MNNNAIEVFTCQERQVVKKKTLTDHYMEAIDSYNGHRLNCGKAEINDEEFPSYLIKHALKRLLFWANTDDHVHLYHAKLCVVATRGQVTPLWFDNGRLKGCLRGLMVTEPHGKNLCKNYRPHMRPHFTIFFDEKNGSCHFSYYTKMSNKAIHKGFNQSDKYNGKDYRSIDPVILRWLERVFGNTDKGTSDNLKYMLNKYLKFMDRTGLLPIELKLRYGSVDGIVEMSAKRILNVKKMTIEYFKYETGW